MLKTKNVELLPRARGQDEAIKWHQGQNSVPNRHRYIERPAQCIKDRHSVSRTGTVYREQAQRV